MKRDFTATALVINSQQEVLLLWHKRLQRWLPPGGHIDANELPEEAAVRECKEETGLDVVIIDEWPIDLFKNTPDEGRMQKRPIATEIQSIPACTKRNEPAHEHLDFVFRAKPINDAQLLTVATQEALQLRWFTKEELQRLDPKTEIYGNVQLLLLYYLET